MMVINIFIKLGLKDFLRVGKVEKIIVYSRDISEL